MRKKEVVKLFDRYLKGECLPDEKMLLDKYLDSYQKEENELFDDQINEKESTENRIYDSIIKKIEEKNSKLTRKQLTFSRPVKIAASFILFICLSLGAYYLIYNITGKSDLYNVVEKTTVPGEKAIITLSDSSIIVLNAGSKLKYPVHFTGKNREIYLEGEAFFEVRHDSTKPFIVRTENITTTVLGTKFNINSYKTEEDIIVSLVEGKVKISDQKEGGMENIIILKPEQRLVYNRKEAISSVDTFDQQKEIGWKDNILKFDNEPLDKVFKVLERNFGIKFEISGKIKPMPKITANFHNEPVATVLEVIKKLTRFQYKTEKENNTIIKVKFYKY